MIVGDDDALRVDDEPGAERIDPVRRAIRRLSPGAAAAAAVLEELLEQLLERGAGRQILQRSTTCVDRLRGRDVDHRIHHLLGHVGNPLRAARGRRARRQGEHQRRAGQSRHDGLRDLTGQRAEKAGHRTGVSWTGCHCRGTQAPIRRRLGPQLGTGLGRKSDFVTSILNRLRHRRAALPNARPDKGSALGPVSRAQAILARGRSPPKRPR